MYARELLSPVVLAMPSRMTCMDRVMAAGFEGNRCERMVHMGGEVTVLLDLGLLCLVRCCTHFRGCDG